MPASNKLLLPLAAVLLFACGMALNEALDRDDVKVTAKVLALDFLDNDEIDQLLPGLEEQRETLLELGKADIDNGLSPALMFNPVLRLEQLPADPTVSAPASAPELLAVNSERTESWIWTLL